MLALKEKQTYTAIGPRNSKNFQSYFSDKNVEILFLLPYLSLIQETWPSL